MISVEPGRWKLVTSASTIWNRKPGVMKMSVQPEPGVSTPSLAADSSVRTLVVPTAITLRPTAFARLIASAASGLIS